MTYAHRGYPPRLRGVPMSFARGVGFVAKGDWLNRLVKYRTGQSLVIPVDIQRNGCAGYDKELRPRV
jgi:hypothetical protein